LFDVFLAFTSAIHGDLVPRLVGFAQVDIYWMLWVLVPRKIHVRGQTIFVENVNEVELVKSGEREEECGFYMACRSTCMVGLPM